MNPRKVGELDREQIELGSSEKFWKLITKRRKERTVSRTALETMIKRAMKEAAV